MTKALRRSALAASCFVLALGSVGVAQRGPVQPFAAAYDIEDLGTIGNNNSYARGINNRGQVAGYAMNGPAPTGQAQAFLLTPPGPSQYRLPISYGNGINDLGVLVGDRAIAPIGGGAYQAFRLINGGEQLVPLLSGYPWSQGIAINDLDEVVGDAYSTTGRRAFLNTTSGTQDLGTLGGSSYGRGINDATEVVGYSPPPGYDNHGSPYWAVGHASYWDRNVNIIDLNDYTANLGFYWVDRFELTKANAINDHHRIVGYAISWDLGGVIHAFQLEKTGSGPSFRFIDLGTLPNGAISYALGVNRGWATVGAASQPTGQVATLFARGRVVDLNTTLGLNTGLWTLQEATGINDNGEIVGWGQFNGATHAFKLTPRAHVSVNSIVPGPVFHTLRIDGTRFTPGAQVRLEVRLGDIGGQLIASQVRTAISTGRVPFSAYIPCGTDLAVNAWDGTSGAYSNVAMVNSPC